MPTFVTGAINSLPAVHFDSVNSTYLAFPRTVAGDFTIVCVFRSSQGSGSGTLYYKGAGLVNGECPGIVNDFGTCLFANGSICAGTGNPDTAVSSGTGFNDGAPHIFTFTRTRDTGSFALYVDGTLAGTASGGTQLLTTPTQLVLGAQQTLNNYLTGDIAEVKIYNTALSDSDRLADEGSLRCKYGLGAGTLPSAPSGLSASAGNRQVSVTWNPVVGANGYNLLWSTNSTGNYTAIASGLTTTNYIDHNALNGGLNYYQVVTIGSCGSSTNSDTVAVLLPLPVLNATLSKTSSTLSWPVWASDWVLLSATNMTPPVSWSQVTNAVVNTNGQYFIQLPANAGAQFFRLSSQ